MIKARTMLLIGAGAMAAVCAAQDATQKPKPQPAAQRVYGPLPAPTATVPAGGLVAVQDPDGGVRGATASEIGAVKAGQAGSSSVVAGAPAPEQILGPGNAIGMRVDGSLDVFSVMKKGPDGKLQMDCVTGDQAANKAVQTPARKREVLDEK